MIQVKKIRKVIKGLSKASKSHKKQAKLLKSAIRNGKKMKVKKMPKRRMGR